MEKRTALYKTFSQRRDDGTNTEKKNNVINVRLPSSKRQQIRQWNQRVVQFITKGKKLLHSSSRSAIHCAVHPHINVYQEPDYGSCVYYTRTAKIEYVLVACDYIRLSSLFAETPLAAEERGKMAVFAVYSYREMGTFSSTQPGLCVEVSWTFCLTVRLVWFLI